MSHLPLSFMNRLNKTESAVFKLWMLYFQRNFLYRLSSHTGQYLSRIADGNVGLPLDTT